MSTDWSIRCIDCNEVGCEQQNGGYEWVKNAIVCAPALAMLYTLNGDSSLRVIHEAGGHVGHIDLYFMARHRGHRLVPHDEYGRDDNQCWERVACEFGELHKCILDKGHAGPCKGGKRK